MKTTKNTFFLKLKQQQQQLNSTVDEGKIQIKFIQFIIEEKKKQMDLF